jgi:rhodanese-related sulfurtransferase
MILKQYYLGCLAHASYLLGDEASGTAIIVDPQRDIQQYLADADKLGFQIRHVFLTHFHADFAAGHLELRDLCGASIHLGSRAQAEYAFVAMKDGDTLEFPGLRLELLETPGHTIESISILAFDLQRDAASPHAVLTGDTLFIGDVGRPDLRASPIGLGGQYATWAGTVLDRTKLIVIIAEPGREQEAALRLGRIGFDHVKGYMNGGMEALAGRPDLVWPTERINAPMVAQELESADPPLLVDIRNPREWATKHINGSVNVPLNHLQERIGEIPRDRRIAVHCAGGYRSSIAAGILHQYGITNLVEMAGGLAAWDAAKLPVVSQG